MKAIQAVVEENPRQIHIKEGAEPESWPLVCERFNDDVERVCDVTGISGYTGLYVCYDEKNQGVHYLVNEDKSLYRMRRRHFLSNIGLED